MLLAMIMSTSAFQIILFSVLVIYSTEAGEPKFKCKEAESQALLKFKAGFYESDAGFLSSWEGRECCEGPEFGAATNLVMLSGLIFLLQLLVWMMAIRATILGH